MDVSKTLSPFFEDLMMNATKSKYVSWSNGVGLLVRQWRVSIAIAVGGMAMLGIALATSQAMPLRGK